MSLAVFGPGILIATRTDIAGSPINVGYAQGLQLDEKATVKGLNGQYQWPIANARGATKPTLKFTSAVISGLAWNTLFYGQSFSSGGIQWTIDEPFEVPAATPFTYAAQNAEDFDADLGLIYAASGLPLQRVAANPTVGQYTVNTGTGTYTFAAADAGKAILATYTNTGNTGQTLNVKNQLIGKTPTFQLDYYTDLNQPTSKPFAARFYYCVSSSLGFSAKLEDFAMPDFEVWLAALANGSVYDIVFPEVS